VIGVCTTHDLGPRWRSTVAAWWAPWNWRFWRDGRWRWGVIRYAAAWTLMLGPFRVSNVRILRVGPPDPSVPFVILTETLEPLTTEQIARAVAALREAT
jgi:hypothetical protein